MTHKTLTTGQVAKLFDVAAATVGKWCNRGVMRHYRLPGSRDRRIPVEDVLRFCRDNDLPVPASLYVRVVTVGLPAAEAVALGEGVVAVADAFTAGVELPDASPDWLVIDFAGLGEAQAVGLAEAVLRLARPPRLVAVLGEDDAGRQACGRLGFEAVLQRPFDVASLAALLT